MGLSKLKTFDIINFMGYNEGSIAFNDKNIINIKGYNSSGKSAVLRALNVFFTYAWKPSLTNFIKHDKSHFELKGTFEDGISIVMKKKRGGPVSYTMSHDGEVLYTTEDSNSKALWNSQVLPDVVSKYFNMLTGDSNLHYRKGRDPLLLVDTTPGQNYKLLSEVLQSNLALKALQLAKKDLQHSRKELQDVEAVREHTHVKVLEAQHLTKDVEHAIDKIHGSLNTHINNLVALNEYRDVLSKVKVLDELGGLKTLDMPDKKVLEDFETLGAYREQLLRKSSLNNIAALDHLGKPPAKDLAAVSLLTDQAAMLLDVLEKDNITCLEMLKKPDMKPLHMLEDVLDLHAREEELSKLGSLKSLELPNSRVLTVLEDVLDLHTCEAELSKLGSLSIQALPSHEILDVLETAHVLQGNYNALSKACGLDVSALSLWHDELEQGFRSNDVLECFDIGLIEYREKERELVGYMKEKDTLLLELGRLAEQGFKLVRCNHCNQLTTGDEVDLHGGVY